MSRNFPALRRRQPGLTACWRDRPYPTQGCRPAWAQSAAGVGAAERRSRSSRQSQVRAPRNAANRWFRPGAAGRALNQRRPADRQANHDPDRASSCRRRRPRGKKRAQPQPDHRKGQKGWRAGKKVPPVALVAGNSQRDRIPRRCVECKRQEGDRSSGQPNNKQCCVRPCRTLLVFRPHHSFALREAHLFLHGDPQPSYAEGHNLVLWAGFCESVGAAQTC